MDDQTLMRRFEDCSLLHEEWTHQAHVRIAYLYLKNHPFEVAIAMLSSKIKRLNAQHEVQETPTSGYSETTTHAFLQLVAATMETYGEALPTGDSEAFCETHPQLMSRHVLRLFYSPERRMHPEAKQRFIEPDLTPLPKMKSEK